MMSMMGISTEDKYLIKSFQKIRKWSKVIA